MKPTVFRPYVVNVSSAHMPNSVKARYSHGAIIKTDGAKNNGLVTVLGSCVEYSGKLHHGGKHRDAFSDWFKAAKVKCANLNDAHEIELMHALGCAPWKIAGILALREKEGK